MSPRAARWFWSLVAAQAIFLLCWAGWHEAVRRHAPVVRLKTKPVDPRDPLRGDYLRLRYEIADVAPDAVKALPIHGIVWVVLEKHGEYHEAVAVSAQEPALRPGQIAVRADRTWSGLIFGIENYFVPEGKGTPRFQTIEVEAAVSPTRRLYLKRVLVDGKSYP
jgi:uncharacterized membrane-anchored protein